MFKIPFSCRFWQSILHVYNEEVRGCVLPLYLVPELPLCLAHLPQLLGQPLVLLRQVADQLQVAESGVSHREADQGKETEKNKETDWS